VVTTCSGNFSSDRGCLGSSQKFNVFSVGQNFCAPDFYIYNLNVERGLVNSALIQVGCVGSQGRKLSVMQNINQHGAFKAPYPNFGSILQLNSIGTSNYNSLQTVLRVRAWHGLTAQFGYTWAHALDEVSQYRGVVPLDSFN